MADILYVCIYYINFCIILNPSTDVTCTLLL